MGENDFTPMARRAECLCSQKGPDMLLWVQLDLGKLLS